MFLACALAKKVKQGCYDHLSAYLGWDESALPNSYGLKRGWPEYSQCDIYELII